MVRSGRCPLEGAGLYEVQVEHYNRHPAWQYGSAPRRVQIDTTLKRKDLEGIARGWIKTEYVS